MSSIKRPYSQKSLSSMTAVVMLIFLSVHLRTAFPQSSESRSSQAAANASLFPLWRVPSDLRHQVQAIGDRIQNPGKEKTVFIGQYTDAAGGRQVTITMQLPNAIRIEGVLPNNATVAFDGTQATGSRGITDDDLLETFTADTIEGLLTAVRSHAALRLLGLRFGPDPRKQPKYGGPRLDIFEITGPIQARADKAMRVKWYYFDSASGLLTSTHYKNAQGVKVETRFSSWTVVANSQYPRTIQRFENGTPIFSFVVNSAAAGPAAGVGNFKAP